MSTTTDLPGQHTLPGVEPENGQPAQPTQQPPAQEPLELTYALLRDFEKQEGCDGYSSDSKRVKLLSDYAWLRNLAPGLTFEVFLEKYKLVANFDAENRKHPDDALKFHCPRAKSQADKLEKPQWSAKEAVDIMVLFVDGCREADRAGTEPVDIDNYLEAISPGYKDGSIPAPEKVAVQRGPTAKRAARQGEPAPADPVSGLVDTGNPLRPTRAGQRVIYARPNQADRQIKGVVEAINVEGDRSYVDFRSDEGELMQGVNILHCTVCDETPPATPEASEAKKLWVPKSQFPAVLQALELQVPMGNVALGESIYQWSQEFDCGMLAEVTVVNGETGPFVDAVLVHPNVQGDPGVVRELDPRQSILGDYRFETPDNGVLLLEVCTRQ